jgi:hypothetical protein
MVMLLAFRLHLNDVEAPEGGAGNELTAASKGRKDEDENPTFDGVKGHNGGRPLGLGGTGAEPLPRGGGVG